MQALAVVAFLFVWCAVGLALARRAERAFARDGTLPTPWFEIAVAGTVALLAVALHRPWQAAACGAACIAIVVASGADVRTGYLFDAVTFPAAIVVALLAIAGGDAASAAWGVVVVVGAFGTIVFVSRGRAMGLGDVKAMYAVGAAFGPVESLVAVAIACASGLITAKLAGTFTRGSEVRFGPHLAVGSLVALVAGDPIAHRLWGS